MIHCHALHGSLHHHPQEVLDPHSPHHHHSNVAGTVVTPYSSIEKGTDNSVVDIDGLKNESSSSNVPTNDCSGDNVGTTTIATNDQDQDLKELLYFKLIAFTGIGLGFAAFALLALAPHDHDHDHHETHHDDVHHDDVHHDDVHHDDYYHHSS